ncbi:MAG: helix-turn-helix domain-containing protein [Solirubrobacteraceae bacterium]
MPGPNPDALLTVPEIARELRYSEVSVRRWIRDGRLRGIQATGREYRVRRGDLDDMIATMNRRTRPKPNDKPGIESTLMTGIALPGQPADQTSPMLAAVHLADEH